MPPNLMECVFYRICLHHNSYILYRVKNKSLFHQRKIFITVKMFLFPQNKLYIVQPFHLTSNLKCDFFQPKVKTKNKLVSVVSMLAVFCTFFHACTLYKPMWYTLIKNKIKFSSYIGKLRVEQLQMTNGLLIYGEIFSHFLIYKETLPHI